jgi:hypothetical protein
VRTVCGQLLSEALRRKAASESGRLDTASASGGQKPPRILRHMAWPKQLLRTRDQQIIELLIAARGTGAGFSRASFDETGRKTY